MLCISSLLHYKKTLPISSESSFVNIYIRHILQEDLQLVQPSAIHVPGQANSTAACQKKVKFKVGYLECEIF